MKVKEFLKKIGVADDIAAALTAEETPEEFDLKAAAKAYQDQRRELWKAKEGQNIANDTLKAEKGKIISTFKNEFRKIFGISANEAKEMDMETFIKEAETRKNEAIEAARTATSEDLVKEANEFKAKWQEMSENIEGIKTKAQKEIEKAQAKAKKEVDSYRINQVKTKAYSKLDLSDTIGRENAQIIIDNVLSKHYKVTGEGEILSKTGTQAISLDGERIYKKVNEAITDIAKARNLLKVSNGGAGNSQDSANRVNPEKLSDHAKGLLARAAAAAEKKRNRSNLM